MTAGSRGTLAERSDPRGRKRANGEGSSYQRADGRWVAQIAWPNGRPEYPYGPTRALVACKLREARQSHGRGLAAPHRTGTLADFLGAWLRGLEGTVRPIPVAQYRGDLRCHVIPRLGRVPLARLTPQHLQELYSELRTAGLSPMSIRHVHAELHRALEQAVRWDAVPRNVASLVDPPQAPRRPMQTLAPEQVRRLLAAAERDRFEALYVLAVTTG
jgi:integrase